MSQDIAPLITQLMPDAAIVTDAAGLVQFWNQGATAMFGFAADEVAGRALNTLIGMRLGEPEHPVVPGDCVEAVCRRKDGVLVCVTLSMRPLELASQGLCQLLTMKDITHLKAERDSTLLQTRHGQLLESTPDAIVIVNTLGHIVLANGQAEQMFGHARADLLGQPVEILLPERFRPGHGRARDDYFGQPRTRPMGAGVELFGRRRWGEEFPVEISLSPLHTENGTMAISAIRDITERRRFERELQEKNHELERANQAKDRFLATMSHELRTPLNAIIGFTGTLLMRLPGPLNGEQDKQLRTVQTSARHLLSLINGLLDLAKIESGRIELTLEPVDACAVLQEVVTTLRPAAESRGLFLEVVLPETSVQVRADRRALQQILLNLCSNAIKFTDAGGVRMELRLRGSGRSACADLCVIDTGIGISADHMDKLFHAFSQLPQTDRPRVEGTGLGLHLSQKLAELLGTSIRVDSVAGRGSRFSLTLERIE